MFSKALNFRAIKTGLIWERVNPLPLRQFLDFSKFKGIADNKSKLEEMEVSIIDGVENIVGNGEMACFVQFLLFPQCFQRPSAAEVSKGVTVW